MMEWLNISHLIKVLGLSAYFDILGGDTCWQLIGWKIMEIKIKIILFTLQ